MHALLYAAGTLAPRTPLSSTNLPCVGLAATPSSELLVVGTAHTPCQSAAEVEAVITAARPDVVVLELDPERLERLLLSTPGTAERRYGADFAAAAKAARDIGVPMARVWDVLLLRRDEALSASTLRGLELARGLRSGRLLRRSYTFATDPAALARAPPHPRGTIPFFTLKRREAAEMRPRCGSDGEPFLSPLSAVCPNSICPNSSRLSLFEPRWLALLDALAAANAPAETPAPNAALINVSFGCVFALNRVWIRGEEPLVVDAGSLAPAAGGYLAGRVAEGSEADLDFARLDLPGREELSEGGEPAGEGPVRVVSVVGLAHANGVLARCATMGLRDADALARAAGAAAELEWAES
ncbi:hypothetical protein EMIHUDRAFT_228967 [Emiliania huxleyi CCMP1516]|uniref:Uncharacterized protein n=2 Tax=Emiliania huxleyi TaxID=2903 RepID=A0A0D3KDR9_EMIH1|nr:hypothetical protein EMIHUDRAFT_228967 [Emiliania huxleyi CCMP1516]EOD33904.1 hypothetical protein EMIHUDRAFT_228967 [Emiliania huxleyi CCMP1516]|eukprot:XP_005786333.1 hypothetical protein EMIHUDRAFT_228967 [Emiliania huxleyi CCMP1516]